MKIFRVICTDQYQQETPETNWHTSRKYCEDYINNSSYKHCLSIEHSDLVTD
jgi:hypothetical protein